MNKILIVILILTTFFMEGCISRDDEAIQYFDHIYLPVQELISQENVFQEQLFEQLIDGDDISSKEGLEQNEEEYLKSISKIQKAHRSLINYIQEQQIILKRLAVYQNEKALQNSAIALFGTYEKVANTDFEEMMLIIQQEEITTNDNTRFNKLLQNSAQILDAALEQFYAEASIYGEQFDINIAQDDDN